MKVKSSFVFVLLVLEKGCFTFIQRMMGKHYLNISKAQSLWPCVSFKANSFLLERQNNGDCRGRFNRLSRRLRVQESWSMQGRASLSAQVQVFEPETVLLDSRKWHQQRWWILSQGERLAEQSSVCQWKRKRKPRRRWLAVYVEQHVAAAADAVVRRSRPDGWPQLASGVS